MRRRNFWPVLALLVVLSAGSVWAQESGDAMMKANTNVSFDGPSGVTLSGYLAKPNGNGPFPAVLMIHEWWGLNRDIARLADALAQEGYVVLAADAYRGGLGTTPQEAMQLVRGTPQEQIAADLDAAFDYLSSRDDVDSSRVAVQGFCFGGTQSMYMGTRNPDLAAVVIFYGSGPITEADKLGSMKQAGPVLGIYGQEDSNIPVTQVRQFETAMNARGVEHTVTVYPGVGHAFVKSSTYNDGGTAQKAWEQMVGFLNKTL